MNIFKQKDRFCGTFSYERLKAADREFWLAAKEVDEALGERNFWLNVYLAFIMNAINSYPIYELAEEGFKGCTELLCLCLDVYNGKKIARNKNIYYEPRFHEFYPHLKEYADKHPECFDKSKSHKSSIFLWVNGLFCKFTDYGMKNFFHRTEKKISKCVEFDSIDECYQKIVEITGEEMMEHLNNAIVERFLKVSLSDIYLQSTINQYLDCLTQRDSATSKYVFRLILDSIKIKEN